jgi:hypothetical protein
MLHVDSLCSGLLTTVNLSEPTNEYARSRQFSDALDYSPAVLLNSGVGGGNPSISGASGFENQYLIGGVNVSGSGYSTLGLYDSVLGPSATGVTIDFIDDLEILDGGFDAEYGGMLGGLVKAPVKSGTNDFHGGIAAYFNPRSFEGKHRSILKSGGWYNDQGENRLDASVQIGGPIVKDKLFFYAVYNPVWRQDFTRFNISDADIARDQIRLPNANREYDFGERRMDQYGFHLTWLITEKQKLDFITFGFQENDNGLLRQLGRRVNPEDDPGIVVQPALYGVSATDSVAGAQGHQRHDETALALKYYATYFPWMNVEAQISFHRGRAHEIPSPAADVTQYDDIRRLQVYNSQQQAAPYTGIMEPVVSPAVYSFGGLGLFQGEAKDRNLTADVKITHNFNLWGSHELKWGGEYADLRYHDSPLYSGPRGDNGPLIYIGSPFDPDSFARVRGGAPAQVRCQFVDPFQPTFASACGSPRYRLTGGSFMPPPADTRNRELDLFIQDKWSINSHLTLNLGVRYTREHLSNPRNITLTSDLTGNPLTTGFFGGIPVGSRDPQTGELIGAPGQFFGADYRFPDEWSPRVGLSWDMYGNGKSKLYASFGRLYERVPNALGQRAFGPDFSLVRARFINPDLTGQYSLTATSGGQTTSVAAGTRLPYKDDYALGYQFELRPRLIIDARVNYRRQGRTLEDTQPATVEAIQNYYYSYYLPYCLNCAPGQTQLFPGAGTAVLGAYRLANVGENSPRSFKDLFTGADVPVHFGKPESRYKAGSLTVTRQRGEGQHFSLQTTYRYAELDGNYEGLFRNDNGQADPHLLSLFDFPDSPLLRGQYQTGRLNTFTRHALRVNVSWSDLLIKNLTAAATVKWHTGQPRTPLLAHPYYSSAGEIPGINPQYYMFDFSGTGIPDFFLLKDYTAVTRGYSGMTPAITTLDVRLGYRWRLGRGNLDFDVLAENLLNQTSYTAFDDNVETTTGVLNPLYATPAAAHSPRTVRLGLKWSF